MSIYGYCRISKAKQSIERQIRNIKAAYPEAVIIQEAFTGTTTDRKEWNRLFAKVQEGDTIIFDSVSRMSRNAEEGFRAYEALFGKGIELVFLKEPQINTATYKTALNSSVPLTGTNIDYILKGVNQFLLELAKEQIRLAFLQAEKEVEDLHQRTKEGLATAKLAGKQIGRAAGAKVETKKSIEAKEQIKKYSVSFGGSLSDIDVMKLTGLARNTYYKYKREIKGGL
jgi:DNA invertase Pin-like site-specific DNA recombinase